MSATRTSRTRAIAALACAALFALSGSAVAMPADHNYLAGSAASAPDPGRAQEQYYSSYGAPEPVHVAPSPAPSDDTPWLAIALTAAALLAIVAFFVAIVLRRHRVRRHAPQVAA
jgi:hypothetical protein